MLNINSGIFDLTNEQKLSSIKQELKYGIDYDYIVESFYCEYKLDVKELKSIQMQFKSTNNPIEQQFLINEFHRLYPEYKSDNIINADIPETIMKKAYFVQSPKGKDGLPAVHYSLKEKMLSDFRAMRSRVKKEMEHCAEIGDKVGEVRFNAKQLAIKVVCNSEYGASNNEFFAHYDPDVAAAVTYASRQLIKFLTNNIETSSLYVDKQFIDENKKQLDALKEIGCVSIEQYDEKDLIEKRRYTIRRIFDDAYNIVCSQVFKINIKPSTVCYQDTDSNYYRNDYITSYYTKDSDGNNICSPERINDCMHMMLLHNQLIANFAKAAIQRRPYALGFEGAFIICRYLNRKKKYYGIKWGDDAEVRLGYKLSPEAYDKEGNLIKDYSAYWKPKKTVIPQPNGEYIYLDVNKLLNEGVNYLDYIHDQNVKCTGVDLARRDQYKFINFFHMMVLQKDLRLMKYEGNNKWQVFSKEESMKDIIDNIIESFRKIINSYSDIANLNTDKHPEINFKITDFSKNGAYRQGKQNAVSTIVRRLKAENKTKYIPTVGERMSYVVNLDEKTKQERLMGRAAVGNVADRSYVIQEVLDELYLKYPEEEFNAKIKDKNLNLTYDEVINAKAISGLDFRYYLECLCKSMALYIVGDVYPEVIKKIDDGFIDPKTANQTISKLQDEIAKDYVKKYFYFGRDVNKTIKTVEKSLKSYATEKSKQEMDLLYQVCPELYEQDITEEEIMRIKRDVEEKLKNEESMLKKLTYVYKFTLTDHFNPFYGNDAETKLYEQLKDTPEKIVPLINNANANVNIYKHILKEISHITFETK